MHKNNKGLSVLEKANMRKSGKWDRQVLKTAKKMNGGSLSAVSKYGSSSKGKAAHENGSGRCIRIYEKRKKCQCDKQGDRQSFKIVFVNKRRWSDGYEKDGRKTAEVQN